MRIISLLPSATEILYSIGCGDQIVGISHECDYPSDVKNKTIITKTKIDTYKSSLEIDQKIHKSVQFKESIYKVDHKRFIALKPDLVITQRLCEVCAITPTDIQAAIRDCQPAPNIVSLHPHSIKEIFHDIKNIGRSIKKVREAQNLVKYLQKRLDLIYNKTKNLKNKPKVFCMEWLDPPYNAGHWVSEQVQIAGGIDGLATKGGDSTRLHWQKIAKYDPDFLIIMACGFSIKRTKKEINVLKRQPEWPKLRAVKENRVYFVNGPAYFNCSGPRVIDGIELLTKIVHPEIFTKEFTRSDFQLI